MLDVKVLHWRYDNGWREIPYSLRNNSSAITCEQYYDEEYHGWHCHVHTSNEDEFEIWMAENMNGVYDCTFRFNSGHPMYTVFIKDDQDATLFKLTWL